MNDLIEALLEHLWLYDRLSQNTLDSYRRDLTKIAQRLEQQQHTWQTAAATDLSAAIYVAEEQSRSQARALSACKRLYAWLVETDQRSDNPTEHLKAPKACPTSSPKNKSTSYSKPPTSPHHTVCAIKPY